jgi:aspartate aminotransferase
MSGVLRIGQGRLSSGSIDQAVAAKLTDVPASYITDVQKEYSTRRDVLYAGLKAIAGVTIPKPEGAFYAIVGLPVDDAEKFAIWLLTDFRLNNETVMVAPAAGFYATPGKGQNEIRIAYVLNCEKLTRAIAIIQAALEVYPGKTK